MDGGDPDGLIAAATRAQTVADVARMLRELRRRGLQRGHGPDLTYRHIAQRTGYSRASVMAYFSGLTLPPEGRLRELAHLLGAAPGEQAALAQARDRVETARHGAESMARLRAGGQARGAVLRAAA